MTYPRYLRPGDHVRVIAPSRSRAITGERELATARLKELGLQVTFGAHVGERDAFDSSPIASRVADLHDAFADPDAAAILTVIGGYNANELLPHLDWELIAANPKILCGYSDITALQNAILTRAGLVTYSGPHWSTFAMRDRIEPTLACFRAALFDDGDIALRPSETWSDDLWWLDQDDRHPQLNEGWWVLQPGGPVRGRIVGGNLGTFNLLQGTTFMPSLDGAVLFVEDDDECKPHHVARNLHSLLQQPEAGAAVGLVIGRFQRESRMTRELLAAIVQAVPTLRGMPVVANADFGHTEPMVTFPIGGEAEVAASPDGAAITLRGPQ